MTVAAGSARRFGQIVANTYAEVVFSPEFQRKWVHHKVSVTCIVRWRRRLLSCRSDTTSNTCQLFPPEAPLMSDNDQPVANPAEATTPAESSTYSTSYPTVPATDPAPSFFSPAAAPVAAP